MENAVQNAVGHEDWGTYAAMYAFGFLFITLSDLGINQYSTKTLASQPELLKSFFPNLFTTKVILLIFYPLLMVAIGWLIMGFSQRELYFLYLLGLVHGGNQFVQFFRANFQAMQAFRIDGFASVVDKVFLILLVWTLFFVGINIESFIYARLSTTFLTIIVFYIVISKLYGWLAPKFNSKLIGNILRGSFTFALITILYSIHDKIDQVMLKTLYGEVETSLYAAAYRWMDAFAMYLWLVLTLFFAKFAYHIKEPEEQTKLIKVGQIITALPLIFVSVFVFFYGEKLLWQQTNSTVTEMHTMVQSLNIIFIAVCFNSIFMIYSTLMTATGYEVIVNWLVVFGIAINVILNFIFIPTYGAIAAAWSTTISLGALILCYVFYTYFYLPVRIPFVLIGKIILAGLGLVICFWLLTFTSLEWYLITSIAGGVYIGICGLLGLIPKDLVRMLRK